ncbi:MAG: hypothetical protein QME79_13295 [Bacillota bacterium]|nr:hypothetical protein [Bacillota bacterium]
MPKKRLDNSTLEVIAEAICGSGPDYSAPGPYRSMSEIHRFFQRVGVQPRGQSSTRKWFVLESLQVLNREADGILVPHSMERILLRLADPKEHRGDMATAQAVADHLNQVLGIEGLELAYVGLQPQLREKKPTAAPAQPTQPRREAPPDFLRLVSEPKLANILTFRWEEAQRCVSSGAYLAAVVMMGSILEGVLLYRAESNQAAACRAKSAPRDRAGKTKLLEDWTLSDLIDVAHEAGWLQGDVKRFSHALRQSRNLVHPYMQRALGEWPDHDTCAICWQVVRAAVADLLQIDSVSA